MTPSDTGPHLNSSYEACEARLHEAAVELETAAGLLFASEPAYAAALTNIVWSIRQSYQAILAYHGVPAPDGVPLDEAARQAERLASMLRTCADRAVPLEPLEASLRGGRAADVSVREAVRTGYHTARNTLATVLGELPDVLGREAHDGLRRAEAARTHGSAGREFLRPPSHTRRDTSPNGPIPGTASRTARFTKLNT